MDRPLRLLILGAHPDDADYHAGGLAAIYCRLGHVVKMVSVTNGDAGHHERKPAELARIRRAEAEASGRVIGATYEVWDHHDGELEPTLALRREIIREIRAFAPDLVLTHRPCDYHPDHRAVGQAVQDASYMVTVPLIVPEVPALRKDPVVMYLPDRFTRPTPLSPDVLIDVTAEIDTIVRMLACHRSQFFEWLPYNLGISDQVPADDAARFGWLREWYAGHVRENTNRYRDALAAAFGERGRTIDFAEIYEVSQYAAPLDAALRQRLFPNLR